LFFGGRKSRGLGMTPTPGTKGRRLSDGHGDDDTIGCYIIAGDHLTKVGDTEAILPSMRPINIHLG